MPGLWAELGLLRPDASASGAKERGARLAVHEAGGLTAKAGMAVRTPVRCHLSVPEHVEAVLDAVLSAMTAQGEGALAESDRVDEGNGSGADAAMV